MGCAGGSAKNILAAVSFRWTLWPLKIDKNATFHFKWLQKRDFWVKVAPVSFRAPRAGLIGARGAALCCRRSQETIGSGSYGGVSSNIRYDRGQYRHGREGTGSRVKHRGHGMSSGVNGNSRSCAAGFSWGSGTHVFKPRSTLSRRGLMVRAGLQAAANEDTPLLAAGRAATFRFFRNAGQFRLLKPPAG